MKNSIVRAKIASKVDVVGLLATIQNLKTSVQDLRNEIFDLQSRVRSLEYSQQEETDRRGYEEKGTRYAGSHPYSCACDRCLSRRFR